MVGRVDGRTLATQCKTIIPAESNTVLHRCATRCDCHSPGHPQGATLAAVGRSRTGPAFARLGGCRQHVAVLPHTGCRGPHVRSAVVCACDGFGHRIRARPSNDESRFPSLRHKRASAGAAAVTATLDLFRRQNSPGTRSGFLRNLRPGAHPRTNSTSRSPGGLCSCDPLGRSGPAKKVPGVFAAIDEPNPDRSGIERLARMVRHGIDLCERPRIAARSRDPGIVVRRAALANSGRVLARSFFIDPMRLPPTTDMNVAPTDLPPHRRE